MTREAERPLDPLLAPLLAAADEADTQRCLEALIHEAEPVIRAVIGQKLRVYPGSAGRTETRDAQAADDLRGEVVVSLLARLRALRGGEEAPIADFRAFAAVTAYRACDTHFRRRYPQRAGLQNRLAYLLSNRTSQHGFALWAGRDGRRWCGFAAWEAQGRRPDSARESRLLAQPERVAAEALRGGSAAHMNPAEVVAALFDWARGPLPFDVVVRTVAEWTGVREARAVEPAAEDGARDSPLEAAPDARAGVVEEAEQRAYLQALWEEIRQLPPRQCTALLLNLRDAGGRGVIALFPLRGIATLREMAAAMEMTAEAFAALWNDLPLEDNAIADLLGATRQQVINLRKVARERLARRMKAYG